MTEAVEQRHFIQQIIDADIESGKWGPPGDRSVITTRFPPEPNGYLHIGHAKAIHISHGLAREYGGKFNLRFDDTNPAKEEVEFVESIKRDLEWLGTKWDGEVCFASDYFGQMYDWAVELIEKGLAYVDESTPEQIREMRGKVGHAGTDSPFRDRPVSESVDLFAKMKAGEIENGKMVLRAKIGMDSTNLNMRDPVMYRVVNAPHHRTGDQWHIYPMYDWAHGLEDSIEGVTHSLCSLEFQDHRPLYDWFIDAINQDRSDDDAIHHPQQIEFSRLAISYTNMSKRYMRQLVEENRVDGWDDPRMITLASFRRRGYTPESIKDFVVGVGVTKFNAMMDMGRLEGALRDDLNKRAPRRMAVLDPIKLIITNWGEHGDESRTETMAGINHPKDETLGTRPLNFAKELYIERDDFMIDPPKKFFRLGPDREVRLRCGYWVKCHDFKTDGDGKVTEVYCTYDPHTKGGNNPPADSEGKVRKVKGTIHWVNANEAVDVEVRLFDRLYNAERPGKKTGDHLDDLNPDSLHVVTNAKVEPCLVEQMSDEPKWPDGIRRFQFERLGYFCVDSDSTREKMVFNRTATLRDSWAKKS
ncbi:MAG: glutamine--tRNA ligase/YqeY domain fusion protein [Phycisphaerales bacterium]|nr:glutamine--tRNA ligase/YqeY domain fusion protein [Phycisphaerales bacterium]